MKCHTVTYTHNAMQYMCGYILLRDSNWMVVVKTFQRFNLCWEIRKWALRICGLNPQFAHFADLRIADSPTQKITMTIITMHVHTGGSEYNDRCCNRKEKVRSAISHAYIVTVAL